MTVKQLIERLEKVEDKDSRIVTSDFGAERVFGVYYDIIDIIGDKNNKELIILMTDKWNRLKEGKHDIK